MRIAFFDSGIGGLTVLRQALDALPNDEYLYFADIRNAPYGVRPKAEVLACTLRAAEFLARREIDALVVACNTATAVAIAELRARYAFPVIGMEPAVKPALLRNTGKKVLVAATTLTLRESKLESLIARLDRDHRVERLALDRLVTLAESFAFDTPEVRGYLRDAFAGTDWKQYDALVLGCTHFLYYRGLLRELAGEDVQLVDGNAGTINHLVSTLGRAREPSSGGGPRIAFYTTGGTPEPAARAARLAELLARLP